MNSTKKEIILESFLLLAGILSLIIFYQSNFLLMFILIFLGGGSLFLWREKEDIYFFTVGFIIGPFVEVISIYFGVWKYANPTVLGMPIWLPFAWGFVVLLITRITKTITKIKAK